MSNASLEQMFKIRWPHLWGLLNIGAQRKLPAGLRDYISGHNALNGEAHLGSLDRLAEVLVSILGHSTVADAYRRDLSAFGSEQKFAEFACEISVCTALSRLADLTSVKLRPAIPGQLKSPDIRAAFSGCEVFAEVKRYDDGGPGPNGRSIFLSNGPNPHAYPRMMALVSKLKDIPGQLPNNSINILFLFHPSLGESQGYIQQALFGHTTFFDPPGSATISDPAALFARKDWSKISGVALVNYCNNALHCRELWQNPKASVAITDPVHKTVRNLA
jgi:hypothetical protein